MNYLDDLVCDDSVDSNASQQPLNKLDQPLDKPKEPKDKEQETPGVQLGTYSNNSDKSVCQQVKSLNNPGEDSQEDRG